MLPKNINWKGGVSKEYKKVRSSVYWKEWREQVFERDNYTCQFCGKSKIELHPHHVLSNADYPEYRFNIKNGTTVCKNCHYLIHYDPEFKYSEYYVRKGVH